MQSTLSSNGTSLRLIRRWLAFFMIALVLSGLSAIPAAPAAEWLSLSFPPGTAMGDWLRKLSVGLHHTQTYYPFLAYGYDWLAFAHLLFAILFLGPWRDPVRNRWVIEFGMIACVLIIPVALIAGHFREIPLWWRVIDCSFGIIGLIPLSICNSLSWRMEEDMEKEDTAPSFITEISK